MDKQCFKCGETKPLGEFYKHKRMADGHLNKCKECTKQDVATRVANFSPAQKLKERRRCREKNRRMRAEGINLDRKGSARTDPYKRKANTAVGNAIRDGVLTRQPCEVCGREPAEAHHEDYDLPLEVNWLCKRHHTDRHIHIGERTLLNKPFLLITTWTKNMKLQLADL